MEQNLADWAKPYLGDKRRIYRIMDSRLEGQYPKKGAQGVAALALLCICREAKLRPRMSEVLATLEQLQEPKYAAVVQPQTDQWKDSSTIPRSPIRHRNPPRRLTTGGSPLPPYQRSPLVHWTGEEAHPSGILDAYWILFIFDVCFLSGDSHPAAYIFKRVKFLGECITHSKHHVCCVHGRTCTFQCMDVFMVLSLIIEIYFLTYSGPVSRFLYHRKLKLLISHWFLCYASLRFSSSRMVVVRALLDL